jgi:hypothetical protein
VAGLSLLIMILVDIIKEMSDNQIKPMKIEHEKEKGNIQ